MLKKPNFGFSASSFWARFKFQTKGQQKDWVLSQHYYLQDEILFYKKSKGSWQESKTGDLFSFSTRELNTRSFSFRFAPTDEFYFVKKHGLFMVVSFIFLSR